MLRFASIAATCVALLCGCSAFQPSEDVVTPDGPVAQNPAAPNTRALFLQAYNSAYEAQNEAYGAQVTRANKDDARTAQQKYEDLLQAGFGQISINCANFFRTRGEVQSWVNVFADVVAAGGTFATGLLAVTGTSTVALSIVALTTSGLYAGISVYEKNFLFGAENIESTQAMTLRALSDNASTVLSAPGALDFHATIRFLMVNQELCKPQGIVQLARESLKGSTPFTISDGNIAQQDATQKRLIAQIAGIGSGDAASDLQIVALCWAADPLQYGGTDLTEPDKGKIRTILGSRFANFSGPDAPPVNKKQVSTGCQALSATAQKDIAAQVANLKKNQNALPASVSIGTGASRSRVTSTFTTFGAVPR